MTNLEILAAFKNANIYINQIEKGKDKDMICVIYRDLPSYYPSFHMAYNHYKKLSII